MATIPKSGKEEAEYTAPLAFMITTSASWWAVCLGFAKLKVREHWLDIDPAMAPLAITLGSLTATGLGPDTTLPPGHVYIGRGHHSHRLPVTQRACPFVPGHNCGADEWMALYTEHILANSGL